MLTHLFKGAGYFFTGVGLMSQPGLRRFVIIPLLVNTVLFALLIVWLGSELGQLVERYQPQLPQWLAWLGTLVWLLFTALIALSLFFAFALLANLIAAPFNSLLAAAAERHLTHRAPADEGGWLQALREAPSAILDELRKLRLFVIWAVPLLLLFLLPVVNLFAPLLWGLFTAWMLALEYLDYPLGNHGLRFAEQRTLLGDHRPLALGFGAMVLFATLVPFFNFLAMPAATLGATALAVKELRHTGKQPWRG